MTEISDDKNLQTGGKRHLPGSERLGKLLFLRLDPILRNLIAVIQRHKEIIRARADFAIRDEHGDQHYEEEEEEERILSLHKAEGKLLKGLQEAITGFPSDELVKASAISPSLLPNQIAASMVVIMDYISIPLVAIFQRPTISTEIDTDTNGRGNDHIRRKFYIRQSAEWKSITLAARIFTTCLETIKQGRASADIPAEKAVQWIIACASSLPSGKKIVEQTTVSFEESGLDRGKEYLEALLNTIAVLLKSKNDALANEITKALDGALLAHLADSCISVVAPPATFSLSTALQALKTLDVLLDEVPDVSMWRSLFPGCFTGLFRTLITGLRASKSTPQSTLKVLEACLRSFMKFLCLTLQSKDQIADAGDNSMELNLAGLKSLAQSTRGESTETIPVNDDTRKILGDSSESSRNRMLGKSKSLPTDKLFLSEVNSRLPGPLSVLVKFLIAAPLPSVRQRGAELCQLIMLDTRSSWNAENLENLGLMALESCLVLSRDEFEEVAESARAVLQGYQNTPAFQKDMKSILIPRTISMVEELPALAQRQSELELRNQLKLITAFLELSNISDKKYGGCKSLRSSMAAENIAVNVRKALSELLSVDFESPEFAMIPRIEVVDQEQPRNLPDVASRLPKLKLLTRASEKEALAMICALGSALGPKHSALFVDLCIADLFNDCLARVESGASRWGRSQVFWCHEWIGCLALIRELLCGAFPMRTEVISSSKTKSEQKALKYLKSLAESIVPIVVSAPLWDLRTTAEDAVHVENQESRLEPADATTHLALSNQSDPVVPLALRGNACLLCNLLQLLGSITKLLGKDAIILVPILLPAVLEKATASSTPLVNQTSTWVIQNLAFSLGYQSSSVLIQEKLDVIAGALLASLRLPGGKTTLPDGEHDATAKVASITRAVLEIVNRAKRDDLGSVPTFPSHEKSGLSCIIELVTTLTERFDCFGSKSSSESETTLAMLRVYDSAFKFIAYTFEKQASILTEESESSLDPSLWLEQLTSFRTLRSESGSDHLDNISTPKEGFETYQRNKDQENDEEPEKPMAESPVSNHEVNFVAILLSRCSFFLSNGNLRLQVESCSAMACGFRVLAIVAKLCKVRRQLYDYYVYVLYCITT